MISPNKRAMFIALCLSLVGTALIAWTLAQESPHANHSTSWSPAIKSSHNPHTGHGRAPEEWPAIPRADSSAVWVPAGYRVEIVLQDLTYPTSVEFDESGGMYMAEGGYIYGDDIAPARIIFVSASGDSRTVADHLNGPVTDLLWHDGRLYISHRGKISVLDSSGVHDLVTGLPSAGDHHNNQMTIGPDGKLYFGQGTATNSGVVGLDNFRVGWLAKYPEVHDVPAKDIRVSDEAFETPDPLAMFAPNRTNQGAHTGHDEHTAHSSQSRAEAKGHGDHAGHSSSSGNAKNHEQHGAQPKESHEGHSAIPATNEKGEPGDDKHSVGHEGQDTKQQQSKHDEHAGNATSSATHNGQSPTVKSYAFQSFAKTPPDDGAIRGTAKANGTILRMSLDGSDVEVYAWGLRNPFGVLWAPNDELYVSDNGYDERGSRPVAHAPDCLWKIKQGGWYGFPDYAAGIPVTDAQFRPQNGPAPRFLMRDHPLVEKPLATLTHHAGAAKLDHCPSERFGFKGQLFVALSGDMNPITGEHAERSGFEVIRFDPKERTTETFFKANKTALGPKGMEYVVTPGPRRPVDVRFTRDGEALYVVDVGAIAIISTAAGPAPRPFPMTGVIWRISPESPRVTRN